MKKFTKESVELVPSWKFYKKQAITKATRINGPFETETREGTSSCLDGYLAVDAAGWPYPIAKEEFEKIYIELVTTEY